MGGILHFPKVLRNMLHILALQSAVILFGGKFNVSLLGHVSYNNVWLDIKLLHRNYSQCEGSSSIHGFARCKGQSLPGKRPESLL